MAMTGVGGGGLLGGLMGSQQAPSPNQNNSYNNGANGSGPFGGGLGSIGPTAVNTLHSQLNLPLTPVYRGINNRELICKWVMEFGWDPVSIYRLNEVDPMFMFVDSDFVIAKEHTQTLQLNEEAVKKYIDGI